MDAAIKLMKFHRLEKQSYIDDGRNLSGVNLSGANLIGKDFSYQDLSDTDLSGAIRGGFGGAIEGQI